MANQIPEDLFTPDEWEMLCDCCGICCLYKIEDADTREILYTRIVCPLLDKNSNRCNDYAHRFNKMPSCVKISPLGLKQSAAWLPRHCAYRCIYEGRTLPQWHPLFSDKSEIAAKVRKKLTQLCLSESQDLLPLQTLTELMYNSIPADSKKSLDRQLLRHVIEDLSL